MQNFLKIFVNTSLLFRILGTYGTVFKAKNCDTQEIVAMKCVRLDDDDEVHFLLFLFVSQVVRRKNQECMNLINQYCRRSSVTRLKDLFSSLRNFSYICVVPKLKLLAFCNQADVITVTFRYYLKLWLLNLHYDRLNNIQ